MRNFRLSSKSLVESRHRGKVGYKLQQESLSIGGHWIKKFKEYRQDQDFLLPPSWDEFVPEVHEAATIA